MKFKYILTILMCLISLFKSVKNNESCLEWTKWKEYKLKYHIDFYNTSLEFIA
jgi:hypothetical protein